MKQVKKLLKGCAVLFTLVALLGFVPQDVQAEEEFVIINGELVGYNGSGGDVTIPEGVTSIGYSAFSGCSSLKGVTIPEGVTNIGDGAFMDCSGLKNITIPGSVTSIGGSAFSGCSSLKSVTIPKSVTSIGERAFMACSGLKSITILGNVTSIGDVVFSRCSSLKSITIPGSVTNIGHAAFFDCSSLSSVMIPEGVTSIGSQAFQYCSGLKSVTIPKSLEKIEAGVFYDCKNLSSMKIMNKNIKLGDIFKWNGVSTKFKKSRVTIYGHRGSTAQKFAKKMNEMYKFLGTTTTFQFKALSGDEKEETSQSVKQLLQKVKADKSLSIKKGKTKTVKVTLPKGLKKVTKFSGKDKEGQVTISYKSSNRKIATVNSKGKVKAQKKRGDAKITVTLKAHDGKKTISRKLTVKVKVK